MRRVEPFRSFRLDTRIDHDRSPIFVTDPVMAAGQRYPLVRQGWSGDNLGDLMLGVKFNLMSEWRQQPAAMAVRGISSSRPAIEESGVTTGQIDTMLISSSARRSGRGRARRSAGAVSGANRRVDGPSDHMGHRRGVPVAGEAAPHERTARSDLL